MELIVVEPETLSKIISQEAEAKLRLLFREFGFFNQEIRAVGNDEEWLKIEDAKRIIPYKSKRRWKLLRDNAEIDFARVGKGFIYNKRSLVDYIYAHSTITKSQRAREKKK